MLLGNYSSKISPSNRIAVPNLFRKDLGNSFIVAKWYETCLVLVSNQRWEELLQRITGKSRVVTQSVRDTDRFILGSAFEISTDAQGRVVLPATLVSFAQLKDEVVFLGLGDRVEIWSKSVWEERESYIAKHAAELLEKIATNEQ